MQSFRESIQTRFLASCLLSFALTVSSATAAQASMIITGAIDGTLFGGQPKAVELYTTAPISDLSIYGLGAANNGGGSDGQEFTFPSDSINAGEFLYVCDVLDDFLLWFGSNTSNTSSSFTIYDGAAAASFNGDDAIELFLNGEVVDVFGNITISGTGEPWEYLDGWVYRKNGTGPDGTLFDIDNWYFSGVDALVGATSNANTSAPFPIGSYVYASDLNVLSTSYNTPEQTEASSETSQTSVTSEMSESSETPVTSTMDSMGSLETTGIVGMKTSMISAGVAGPGPPSTDDEHIPLWVYVVAAAAVVVGGLFACLCCLNKRKQKLKKQVKTVDGDGVVGGSKKKYRVLDADDDGEIPSAI